MACVCIILMLATIGLMDMMNEFEINCLFRRFGDDGHGHFQHANHISTGIPSALDIPESLHSHLCSLESGTWGMFLSYSLDGACQVLRCSSRAAEVVAVSFVRTAVTCLQMSTIFCEQFYSSFIRPAKINTVGHRARHR